MVVDMCILYDLVLIMLNFYVAVIIYVNSVMVLKFDELNCYILSFHTCDVQRAAKISHWADDTTQIQEGNSNITTFLDKNIKRPFVPDQNRNAIGW
jgi:hypothetical protein